MMRRDPITDHAVVRFLERHDDIDLGPARAAVGGSSAFDADLLAYLSDRCGLDVAAVRRRMMTPEAIMAIGVGACGVVVGNVRLIIVDGRVVTVKCVTWGKRVHRACRHLRGRPRPRRERRRYELEAVW